MTGIVVCWLASLALVAAVAFLMGMAVYGLWSDHEDAHIEMRKRVEELEKKLNSAE